MKTSFVTPQNDQIEYIIGIDFGHGETSAAICNVNDDADPDDIDLTNTGNTTIPSTLYISAEDQSIYVGQRAVDKYKQEKSGDFYAYFKTSPYTLDENKLPELRIMKMFMKEVYDMICHSRSELMEGDRIKNNHVVFIACPSKSQNWGDEAMQNYVQLAVDAGLPIAGASIDDKFSLSGIVRESRAAYIRTLQSPEASAEMKKGILVVDFGSSTIDVTYYKDGEVPIDKGYPIGASIVEKSIKSYLEKFHDDWDEEQHPEVVQSIAQYISDDVYFLFKIRKCKEDYYRNQANEIEISYRLPSYIATGRSANVNFYISKKRLTDIILQDYIKKVTRAFGDFRDSIIKDNPISLLCLTGGASRMDFVQDIAHSVFGDVKTMQPKDYSLTVSNGIATAGRADIKLFYLAEELFKKEASTIYWAVRELTTERICNRVIDVVDSAYRSFLNGNLYANTIVALEDRVKKDITSLTPSYKEELDKAFQIKLENYVNSYVAPNIISYLQKHFPHYDISSMGKYYSPENVKINISTGNMNTLNTAIQDAVNKITESFLEKVFIVVLNILWGVIVIGVEGLRNVKRFIQNQFRDSKHQLDYIDIDKELDDTTISFNNKKTVLTENQRKEVYNAFCSKKREYEDSLKKEIEHNLPAFMEECDNAQKQTITEYIVSEMNSIQLQIK